MPKYADESAIKDVIAHLESYGSITQAECTELYGAQRLSAIIFILRHERGMRIESERFVTKNRYGHTTHPTRYRLVKDGE